MTYVILVLALITGGVFAYVETRPDPVVAVTPTPRAIVKASPTLAPAATVTPTPAPLATAATLPATVTLNVPFTVQAPYGKWDEIHEETCEEASLLMAAWYATGKTGGATNGYKNQIPLATAEAELLSMNAWEEENFGSAHDTNAEQTARIAREKLGLKNVTVKTVVTEESIKQELVAGNVIIMPAAGRLLKNPNFKAPGPPYHMYLITGYTATHFIAHDPGTRKGEDYLYSFATVVNASHDWLGSKDTIMQGPQRMVVIGK